MVFLKNYCEFSRIDGLGDEIVHSSIIAAFHLFGECSCGQCNNWDMSSDRCFDFPDLLCRFLPIEFGHLNIHENQVRFELDEFIYGDSAVLSLDNHCSGRKFRDEQLHEGHIHLHVIRNQDE